MINRSSSFRENWSKECKIFLWNEQWKQWWNLCTLRCLTAMSFWFHVEKQNGKIITAQIQIKIMFSETKYTDYIKLSLLSVFKLFDSVFKMVEMQFWAIILNTLKFIMFFKSRLSCWFNTWENFDLIWSYLSTSCLGDLLYRYSTQISFSINKWDSI